MSIIRVTTTVCPECRKRLKGFVAKKGDGVFLQRRCPEHGFFSWKISAYPELYSELDHFYFSLVRNQKLREVKHYWICLTGRCNQNCPYCSVKGGEVGWQSLNREDFELVLKKLRGKKISLSGGEPTLHPDLLWFVRRLVKADATSGVLTTNGLRLADLEFCRQVKEAGTSQVMLSIEGLEERTFTRLGMKKFHSLKLQALENLRELQIPTRLSPVIFRGINEFEIKNVIDYALKNKFVKEIVFNGFSWLGRGRENFDKRIMMMPDELMDIIWSDFSGGSPRKDFFLLQKFVYFLMNLLSIRFCIYTQIVLLIRNGKKRETICQYLQMKGLERLLKTVEKLYSQNKTLAKLYFMLGIIFCFRPEAIKIIADTFRIVLITFFGQDFSRLPSRILPVLVNTNCSPVSMDFEVSRNCMAGSVIKENRKIGYNTITYLLATK